MPLLADNLTWAIIVAVLGLVVFLIEHKNYFFDRMIRPLTSRLSRLQRRWQLAQSVWIETQFIHEEGSSAGLSHGVKAAAILVLFSLFLMCVPAWFAYDYPVANQLPSTDYTMDLGLTRPTVYLTLGPVPIVSDKVSFWSAVIVLLLIVLLYRIPWLLAIELSRYGCSHPKRYLFNFCKGYFGVVIAFALYLFIPFCLSFQGIWRYSVAFLVCWTTCVTLVFYVWFRLPKILDRELALRGKFFPDSETSL